VIEPEALKIPLEQRARQRGSRTPAFAWPPASQRSSTASDATSIAFGALVASRCARTAASQSPAGLSSRPMSVRRLLTQFTNGSVIICAMLMAAALPWIAASRCTGERRNRPRRIGSGQQQDHLQRLARASFSPILHRDANPSQAIRMQSRTFPSAHIGESFIWHDGYKAGRDVVILGKVSAKPCARGLISSSDPIRRREGIVPRISREDALQARLELCVIDYHQNLGRWSGEKDRDTVIGVEPISPCG
jgi:hypothetical protein